MEVEGLAQQGLGLLRVARVGETHTLVVQDMLGWVGRTCERLAILSLTAADGDNT